MKINAFDIDPKIRKEINIERQISSREIQDKDKLSKFNEIISTAKIFPGTTELVEDARIFFRKNPALNGFKIETLDKDLLPQGYPVQIEFQIEYLWAFLVGKGVKEIVAIYVGSNDTQTIMMSALRCALEGSFYGISSKSLVTNKIYQSLRELKVKP